MHKKSIIIETLIILVLVISTIGVASYTGYLIYSELKPDNNAVYVMHGGDIDFEFKDIKIGVEIGENEIE